MSVRNLTSVFAPAGVALIGASRDAHSVGGVVARNLRTASFEGPVWFVNPNATEILGLPVVRDVAGLPMAPELAIIATPAPTVPQLVHELGTKGAKAVIVLTAGFTETGASGEALQQQMLSAAQPFTLRIVGPNCVGVLTPGSGLNASFAHRMPAKGNTAFVTQSGAILTAVLDWAASRSIGFSHLVSLGGMADIDFGDMLDYLAADGETNAVLLYVESITNARKFMSAARRCARIKPVIVVKSGRFDEGARAARSHTGALAGSDAVYDTAFRRAGMLRVSTIEDLFDTLETVSHGLRLVGDKLGIITNGGGAGVLATDHLIENGGRLAQLAPATVESLNQTLPKSWSHGNPVDIIGDAGAERYRAAVESVIGDPDVDAVLVINCPVALADPAAAADAVIAVAREASASGPSKPILASWLGEDAAAAARQKFDRAGIPQYPTPEKAVTAAMRLVRHARAQDLLLETPTASVRRSNNTAAARQIIDSALATSRSWLSTIEAHGILKAYGIPTTDLRFASTAQEAAQAATALGFPVALKVVSPQIVHKSDVGGVVLHLKDPLAVERAATNMLDGISARVEGFLVQPMATRVGAHELIVGLSEDELFGPTILFGQGGTAVEVIADRALALPPINDVLARDLISRTRVSRLLAGYRDRPAANDAAIVDVLMAVQDIAVELPEVVELDINPLWADAQGVLALDARIRVKASSRAGTDRFAIRPYPDELRTRVSDRAGLPYKLRPIRPEDAGALQMLVGACDPEDIRMRFFSGLRKLPEALAKRLCQIDYDREMAFVAEADAVTRIAGVVRVAFDPDMEHGEFAVLVRSDLKGTGLGYALMQHIIAHARSLKAKQLFGDVLAENERMLAMCRELGFKSKSLANSSGALQATLDL